MLDSVHFRRILLRCDSSRCCPLGEKELFIIQLHLKARRNLSIEKNVDGKSKKSWNMENIHIMSIVINRDIRVAMHKLA